MIRVLQGGAVVLLSVGLTVFVLDASETWQGREGTMLGQLFSSRTSACPAGMVSLAGYSFSCVDQYEAAPDTGCPTGTVSSIADSGRNLQAAECAPVSQANVEPWRYVSREEARLLCRRAGKRLPTAEEWYQFALGSSDTSTACNLDTPKAALTGSYPECVSAVGVHDAVGNVWEWVSEDVPAGSWNGRTLPAAGYVTAVDQAGIAVETDEAPLELYHEDYFWNDPTTIQAMMRGGFYGSGADGGVYAVHAGIAPETRGQAIGFRCVL